MQAAKTTTTPEVTSTAEITTPEVTTEQVTTADPTTTPAATTQAITTPAITTPATTFPTTYPTTAETTTEEPETFAFTIKDSLTEDEILEAVGDAKLLNEIELTVCENFYFCQVDRYQRSTEFTVSLQSTSSDIESIVNTYNQNCKNYKGTILDLSNHEISASDVCSESAGNCVPVVETGCDALCISLAVIGSILGVILIGYLVIALVAMEGDFCWCINATRSDPMKKYIDTARMQSIHGSYVPEITSNFSKPPDPIIE